MNIALSKLYNYFDQFGINLKFFGPIPDLFIFFSFAYIVNTNNKTIVIIIFL